MVEAHSRPPMTITSGAYRGLQDTRLRLWEVGGMTTLVTLFISKKNIFFKKENVTFFHLKITLSHPCSLITKENKADSLWRTWEI